MRRARGLAWVLATGAMVGGCGLVLGYDGYHLPSGGSGGSGGAGAGGGHTTTSGSAGAGTGGAPACVVAGDCPGTAPDCNHWSCQDGHCTANPDPFGSSCGRCAICNQGSCDDVPLGSDPNGDCPGDTCNGAGKCACTDGLKDNGEDAIDCGGSCMPCPPCSSGTDCGVDPPCGHWTCPSGTCVLSPMNDTSKCAQCKICDGGNCIPSAIGTNPNNDSCNVAAHEGTCDGNGECSCLNGMKDNGESDVDCGGAGCDTCPLGKECTAHSDCTSGKCTDGVCCNTLACGGRCKACNVDGSGMCRAVPAGQHGKCGGETCQSGGACTCGDGMKDGDESDVDCGDPVANPNCSVCAVGAQCNSELDCISNRCSLGVCALCFSDSDCATSCNCSPQPCSGGAFCN